MFRFVTSGGGIRILEHLSNGETQKTGPLIRRVLRIVAEGSFPILVHVDAQLVKKLRNKVTRFSNIKM